MSKLTAEQHRILREKGTEAPFSGKYYKHDEVGTYKCAGCKQPLFKSDMKFGSSCGWPSFHHAIDNKVEKKKDLSHGMLRTEMICKKCKGHLGHVFRDGPREHGGKRFCINSLALDFEKT